MAVRLVRDRILAITVGMPVASSTPSSLSGSSRNSLYISSFFTINVPANSVPFSSTVPISVPSPRRMVVPPRCLGHRIMYDVVIARL